MCVMHRLRANAALVAICISYFAVVLVLICNRAPSWDEGWFASPAYNLAHHGHFGTTTIDPQGYLLRPELTHINQRTYWVLPFSLLLQIPWYAVFGFGLVQMRLMTALFGALAIIALHRWTLRLTGSHLSASVAALLMAQDNLLLLRSADGRMDVMCLSLGLMGQAAYLALRERSVAKALLAANTLLCLAFLTHPNAVIPLLTLTATVVVLDASRLRPAHIMSVAIPYLIGGAALAAWALPDPAGFTAQLMGNKAADRMNLLRHPLDAVLEDVARYKYVYIGAQYAPGKFAPIKAVLLITWFGGYLGQTLVGGLKQRSAVVLALCGAIPVLVLTFFNVKNSYYLIYIVPFFAANAGCLFDHLWRRGVASRRFAAAALSITLLVSGAVTGRRVLTGRDGLVEYQRLAARANSLLPVGQRMIAPASWAFGVGFDRVVQDDNLGFYSRLCPAVIIDSGLAADEIENLRKGAPAVLQYRNQMLTTYYKAVDNGLYQRISCPAGTHAD